MLAAEKSEFGVCGVVGGMMVIELLAGKMRRGRGRIAAVEDDMRQTYTVKHIRKEPFWAMRPNLVPSVLRCWTLWVDAGQGRTEGKCEP